MSASPTTPLGPAEMGADLSLLQGRHATAQHGAAVTADLQEELPVVAAAPVLTGLHDQGQRRSVNDQTVVLHVG